MSLSEYGSTESVMDDMANIAERAIASAQLPARHGRNVEIPEEKQPDIMAVMRTSMITGVTHTLDLPITQEQLDGYETGDSVLQNAFPELSEEDRDFIKTGFTRAMDPPVTDQQLALYTYGEALLQNAFPSLSREEREFNKTGITPQEWYDYVIGPEEDPEIADDRLYRLAIAPETLAAAIDILRQDDAPYPDEDEPAAPDQAHTGIEPDL
jgi:hypothetical protein